MMADFFYRLPTSRQHIFSLLILFIVPLVMFFQTTLGGKEIERHDITQWRAGAESIIDYREEFGEEPLWASNMFGGMPSFVVSTKNKFPHLNNLAGTFNKIYPAFQYWIMLSGMYVLLILIGFRPLSAIFGSITFSLTTYFPVIIMAGHTSKFFTLAFVPWTFAGYWLMTRKGKLIAGLLLFTTAMALEVRAGHPQITYYFAYLLAALWIYDSVQWFKSKELKKLGVITGLLILGGIMGILGNAERTLSQKAYADYSIRGGSDLEGSTGLDENYAFAWSQGISETLTLLVPNLYGGASPDYWGPKSITSGPHYLGALAFLFMIIGIWKTKDRLVFVFLGVGILAIFFAWGNSFPILNRFAFNYIPFFDKFRAPETWLVVTSFCFTIVSVYGIQAVLSTINEKSTNIKSFIQPIGAVIGIFLIVFVMIRSFEFVGPNEVAQISAQIAQQNQVPADNPQVIQRAETFIQQQLVPTREEKANRDVLRFGMFLVFGIAIVYGATQKKISPSLAGVGLFLLAGIDMIQVGQRYMSDDKFVTSNVDTERIILSESREQERFIKEENDKQVYPYRVFPLDINFGPFANAVPSYFYPSLGGYSGAKLSVAQDVLMAARSPIFGGQYGLNLGLLSALNTRYITYNPGLVIPGITPVFTAQNGGVVYENENVLPKAFFVDSVITVQSPSEAYELLFPGNVDFSTTAIVEGYSPTHSTDSASVVEVTNYTGAEMSFEVSRTQPGFMVISEIYYPDGWIATINGEETQIHKTNYLLRGIEVPAGTHTIELDFRPSSYYNGVIFSTISLLFQIGLGVFLLIQFVNHRKKSAE